LGREADRGRQSWDWLPILGSVVLGALMSTFVLNCWVVGWATSLMAWLDGGCEGGFEPDGDGSCISRSCVLATIRLLRIASNLWLLCEYAKISSGSMYTIAALSDTQSGQACFLADITPLRVCLFQVGIEMKFKDQKYPVVLAPTHVPELNSISVTDAGIEVSWSVPATDGALHGASSSRVTHFLRQGWLDLQGQLLAGAVLNARHFMSCIRLSLLCPLVCVLCMWL
jgi:hypothetical protein